LLELDLADEYLPDTATITERKLLPEGDADGSAEERVSLDETRTLSEI
jgi:hypothetical protein